jgi:hypothetical protein
MKSLSLLQIELSEAKKKVKALQNTKDALGTEFEPQMTIKLADAERELAMVEAEIKTVKKAEASLNKEEKLEEKTEEDIAAEKASNWIAFQNALKVYDETQICFHKSSSPNFFYQKVYQDFDSKTGKARPPCSELLFFSPSTLYPNWLELQSKRAQQFLNMMVHGLDITVVDPDTDTEKTFTFKRKVYTKLGNTRHTPDPETYNMIDLSNIMRPSAQEKECPPLIRELLLALTGNVVNEDGTLTKQENLDWFEKWLYGVLVADIGNNMLPSPIIFGSGKVGKNALFDKIFPRVFGSELCFTGLWENLDGNFNGFKLGKVFIFLDEIPPRDEWNKFKNLTGSVTELIKKKYGPEFVIENTVAIATGSNQPVFPLPLEDGKQMTRVSPIATDPRSTFAENVYSYFTKVHGEGAIQAVLQSQDIDTTNIENNKYELGDKFLRTNEELWCSADQVQQFLNYLETKFGGTKYVLSPLRGNDWNEIVKSRPNPLHEVIEYVQNRDMDIITLPELYEIYTVLVGDKKNNMFIKTPNNFAVLIWPMLSGIGYERKPQCRIKITPSATSRMKQMKNGNTGDIKTQVTVYHKIDVDPKDHVQCVDDYITEEMIGSTPVRRLIYKE